MPIPLIVWGALALGGALGVGGTLGTTDAVEDIGDAVAKSTSGLTKLMTTTAIIGAGYFVAKNQGWIK